MRKTVCLLILSFMTFLVKAQLPAEEFEFHYDGFKLNGVINQPETEIVKGIVLIIHGSGYTNAVAQNWHFDIRELLVSQGYSTFMWDKIGCGKSEGTFDYNQSVRSSALEALEAIEALKKKDIPGSGNIGLWGISRAGWIAPLVINEYQNIKFWISVSGVDEKENFGYLLEQNLIINGHPLDSVRLIVEEWRQGGRISHKGGKYEEFMAATSNLSANSFYKRFTNGGISKESYYNYQPRFMLEEFDEKTGQQVYIKDFNSILAGINCPVLALFGETDKNVEWTRTKELYERAFQDNVNLTIKSFADCNHNMYKCETGGFYEMQDNNLPYNRCDGFVEEMRNWLKYLENK